MAHLIRIIDNLPAATPKLLQNAKEETITYHESGFPLGINGKTDDKGNGPHALNNHVNIKLLYHKDPANYEGLRIVGFEVDPQRCSSLHFRILTPIPPARSTNSTTLPVILLLFPQLAAPQRQPLLWN
jgi:hypothetical protein